LIPTVIHPLLTLKNAQVADCAFTVVRTFRCRWSQNLTKNQFLSGNEACVLAAINAGAGFFSGYPISPAT
jgi:hypothetical protein